VTQRSEDTCRSMVRLLLAACGPVPFSVTVYGPDFGRVWSTYLRTVFNSKPSNVVDPTFKPYRFSSRRLEPLLPSQFQSTPMALSVSRSSAATATNRDGIGDAAATAREPRRRWSHRGWSEHGRAIELIWWEWGCAGEETIWVAADLRGRAGAAEDWRRPRLSRAGRGGCGSAARHGRCWQAPPDPTPKGPSPIFFFSLSFFLQALGFIAPTPAASALNRTGCLTHRRRSLPKRRRRSLPTNPPPPP
jgi:hypothetical protein